MASVDEQIKDFQSRRLNPIMIAWEEYVTDPYKLAYHRAFDSFDKTLKKQAASDKMKLELAFAALSLCGGSVLTAVFAETAVKAVAGKIAVDFICKYNMERAFTVAHFVATNKTAGFIVGGLWDQGASMLSNKTKTLFTQSAGNFPGVDKLVQKPYEIEAALGSFVKSSYLKVNAVCEDILASGQNDTKKGDAFSKLSQSRFCKPPQRSAAPADLAERIELTFYMKLVLNTDQLVQKMLVTGMGMGGGMPQWVPISKKNITAIPGQKDYPKSSHGSEGSGIFRTQTMTNVEYDSVGQDLIDRMNLLYKQLYKTTVPFIDSDWFGEKTSAKILQNAYQVLKQLGDKSTAMIELQSKKTG